jgi:hypothetical protein
MLYDTVHKQRMAVLSMGARVIYFLRLGKLLSAHARGVFGLGKRAARLRLTFWVALSSIKPRVYLRRTLWTFSS